MTDPVLSGGKYLHELAELRKDCRVTERETGDGVDDMLNYIDGLEQMLFDLIPKAGAADFIHEGLDVPEWGSAADSLEWIASVFTNERGYSWLDFDNMTADEYADWEVKAGERGIPVV